MLGDEGAVSGPVIQPRTREVVLQRVAPAFPTHPQPRMVRGSRQPVLVGLSGATVAAAKTEAAAKLFALFARLRPKITQKCKQFERLTAAAAADHRATMSP